MQSLSRTLFFISLSVIFLMLGSTYFTTFVSLKLASIGISESIIGFVHTAYSIGFVIGTFKAEYLIKKLGHIRSFIFFGIIFSIATIANKFYLSIPGWMFFRLISGACLAALYVVIESYYLLISPAEKRGKILALYMISLYVSQAISQFFYNIIPFESDAIFDILSFTLIISCFPVFFLKNPELPLIQEKLSNILKNPSISWLGLHISFMSGAILTALYSFLPLLAQKLNLKISIAMSLMILGGLIIQWPIGILSDRFDRKKLLISICVLTFIPTSIPFFFPVTKALSYLIILLIGSLSFTLYPIGMTVVCENKPKEELTSLTTLLVLFYSFGMIFGPLLTPIFNKIKEPHGLYLQIILFMFLLGFHAIFNIAQSFRKKNAIGTIE